MDTLEDRVRAAAQAAADTVADDSAPPLLLPQRARRLTWPAWRGGRAPEDSVLAFSAATGQEAVLDRASINGVHGHGCYSPPVWISNAGSKVLVTCFQAEEIKAGTQHYVVNVVLINHGHATVLPWLNATAEGFTAFP